jgi:Holliday junction resolvasome RuvABC DNA-binding subunit
MNKLKDLEGVGDKTAEILEETGITIDDLAKFNLENDIEKLIDIGINKSQAEKILSNFTKPSSDEEANHNHLDSYSAKDDSNKDDDLEDDEELDYSKRPDLTYNNANKYIKYAFEQSEYYNEELSESLIEREFRKFVNKRL